jgi:hypothetical protein
LLGIEKALKEDQKHASHPEWKEIEGQVLAAKESLDSFLGREKWNESAFDIEGLAKTVDEAASRQVSLKAKPIEDWSARRCPDVVRNKMFGCGPEDDWEEGPVQRKPGESNGNELKRRLSMEDLGQDDDDP